MAGLALAAICPACASTGAVPKPFPASGAHTPQARAESPGAGIEAGPAAEALVATALDLRGTRYRNGGSDREGFDCSGFTLYVFAQHGVPLPREVREQFGLGRMVRGRPAAGDLLFFAIGGRGASHVAIAMGDDEFVHAPSSRGVVRVERLSSGYWARRFLGARRITRP
jgi:cell wall-associated NlpC family hydrolase